MSGYGLGVHLARLTLNPECVTLMKFFFNRKAHNVFNAIDEVRAALGAQQYIASDEIATVMFLAERLGKPVLAAGPAGVELLRRDAWAAAGSVELLADYNAAEPLGLEGTKATDDLADYDGKLVLGALAIGGPKMKVHKASVRRLFESNDQVLDTEAVYAIAKELV